MGNSPARVAGALYNEVFCAVGGIDFLGDGGTVDRGDEHVFPAGTAVVSRGDTALDVVSTVTPAEGLLLQFDTAGDGVGPDVYHHHGVPLPNLLHRLGYGIVFDADLLDHHLPLEPCVSECSTPATGGVPGMPASARGGSTAEEGLSAKEPKGPKPVITMGPDMSESQQTISSCPSF